MLKNMRREDINIVAIDQHMTKEESRILFLHYWVEGKAAAMAQSLKSVLNAQAMSAYVRRTDEPSQQLSGAACTSVDVRLLYKADLSDSIDITMARALNFADNRTRDCENS